MMMNIDTTCHLNGNLLQQVALERHVNAHFNQEVGQNGNGNSSQGVKRECAPAKLVRRNSKKSKYRRSKAAPGTVPSISIIDNLFIFFFFLCDSNCLFYWIFAARLFDYFDSGVMERLRHQLFISQESQQRLGLSSRNNCLTVQSQVQHSNPIHRFSDLATSQINNLNERVCFVRLLGDV